MKYMIAFLLFAASMYSSEQTEFLGVVNSPSFENSTYLHLGEATDPYAVATLTYHNRGVNVPSDNGVYEVSFSGLNVAVTFTLNHGKTVDGLRSNSDLITVNVPDGYVAIPSEVNALEGSKHEIQIYMNVGM